MKKYNKGTKFKVCPSHDLKNKGWRINSNGEIYTHKDFPGCVISLEMMDYFAGQILTVSSEDPLRENWYNVNESQSYVWPVATFLEEEVSSGSSDHECEEGMTEIFGWMICKHCGLNLRKIK